MLRTQTKLYADNFLFSTGSFYHLKVQKGHGTRVNDITVTGEKGERDNRIDRRAQDTRSKKKKKSTWGKFYREIGLDEKKGEKISIISIKLQPKN